MEVRALNDHEQKLHADLAAEKAFLDTLAFYGPASAHTEVALKNWGRTRRAYLNSLGDTVLSKARAARLAAGLEV